MIVFLLSRIALYKYVMLCYGFKVRHELACLGQTGLVYSIVDTCYCQ